MTIEQPNASDALSVLGRAMIEPIRAELTVMLADEVAKVQSKLGVQVHEINFDGMSRKIEHRTHVQFDKALKIAAATMQVKRHFLLLVGPAGSGKTKLASDITKALGLRFGMFTGSAGFSESHLTGKLLPTGEGGKFEYAQSTLVDFVENGGGILGDELDGLDPNVALTLNPLISNGVLVVENRKAVGGAGLARRHDNFMFIGAANTFGTGADAVYTGRNALDGSLLDRAIVVHVDYDRDLEADLGPGHVCDWVWSLRNKAQTAKLRRAVTTRTVEQMALLLDIGFSFTEAKKMILAGWKADELSKVGETV